MKGALLNDLNETHKDNGAEWIANDEMGLDGQEESSCDDGQGGVVVRMALFLSVSLAAKFGVL